MSDKARVIKKYPNRRLYDTEISSYITLGNVKQLVLERVPFRVVDAKTEADITRAILLQIISEQEDSQTPIFTSEVLANIIRLYGNTFQGVLGAYLERSLNIFLEQQQVVRKQMNSLIQQNPLTAMTELAERNITGLWRSMNEHILSGKGKPDKPKSSTDSEKAEKTGKEERQS